MMTRTRRLAMLPIAALLAAGGAGCTVDKESAPSLSGPSEFALSVTATAVPDQVPRDGTTQSTVTMTVRDAANQPVSRQRLSVVSDIGTVVPAEVETDDSGRASLLFTAPPSGTVGNSALIRITPIGSAAGGAVARTLTIGLTGPVNGTAPIPDFDITPPNPEENALVSFDASTTTDEGNVPCVDRCTYQWDFGDGSATGELRPTGL